MKPALNLSPVTWTQLAPSTDLTITWDAAAVAGFAAIGLLVGTSPGDSDLGTIVSTDPTDSLVVSHTALPASGLIHITAYLDYTTGQAIYDRYVRPAGWPPHTIAFAELADRYAVEQAMSAVTTEMLEAVAGTGWLGMAHYDVGDNDEDLRSTGDLSAPTIWGRWQIEYGAAPQAFFDDSSIVTEGWVKLVIYQEYGSATTLAQAVLALYRVALKEFETSGGQAFAFFTEAQSFTNRDPNLGAWVAVTLAVPFRGL